MNFAKDRAHWLARRLPPGLEVEDLEQEFHLAALRGRRSTTGPMQDLRDRWTRWQKHERFAAPAEHFPSHEWTVISKVDLSRPLEALSKSQREVIELTDLLGLTLKECAEHLGASYQAVQNRRFLGISKLRRKAVQ